jgi:hypothetical protein
MMNAIALCKHPLDNSLDEYMIAAEMAGFEWVIHGGQAGGRYEVRLFKPGSINAVEAESTQVNYAFHAALKKAGVA